MSEAEIRAYLAKIGAKGGKKSRRVLSSKEARAMAAKSAKVRKKKRKTGKRP